MIALSELISRPYRDLQIELHTRPGGYGDKGDKWAQAVRDLITRFYATSVLDYGCGQGALARALRGKPIPGVRIAEYDPAVPGKDGTPLFADLIVVTDVLEHVEPDRLDQALAHLRLLKRKAVFAVIATRASSRTMADGRNAHLIVEQDAWWLETLTAAGFVVEPGPKSPHPKPSRELSVVLA